MAHAKKFRIFRREKKVRHELERFALIPKRLGRLWHRRFEQTSNDISLLGCERRRQQRFQRSKLLLLHDPVASFGNYPDFKKEMGKVHDGDRRAQRRPAQRDHRLSRPQRRRHPAVAVGGATSHEFWDDNARHKFDLTVLFDKNDARLRPGFAARLSIRGDQLSRAVSIPREAVFDREGKKIVYCKRNRSFEAQEVKLRALSEGRAIIEGIQPGTVVALVNPEARGSEKARESGAAPALGPSTK